MALAHNLAPFLFLLVWLHLVAGQTSTLQQVTDFGDNPTNAGMYVYRPTNVASSPTLIVAVHYCGGQKQSLTRDGGGDSTAIANMVAYAKTQYGVDPDRIYVTGTSSGGELRVERENERA